MLHCKLCLDGEVLLLLPLLEGHHGTTVVHDRNGVGLLPIYLLPL